MGTTENNKRQKITKKVVAVANSEHFCMGFFANVILSAEIITHNTHRYSIPPLRGTRPAGRLLFAPLQEKWWVLCIGITTSARTQYALLSTFIFLFRNRYLFLVSIAVSVPRSSAKFRCQTFRTWLSARSTVIRPML